MRFPLAVPICALLAVAGCGLLPQKSPDKGGQPNMNMQQAADRAEQLLKETGEAIKPPVTWGRGPSSDPICTDFKNDGTGTGQVMRRMQVLTVISEKRVGNFLGLLERSWKERGYTITNVRDHPKNPAIYASSPDGFAVSVVIGFKGQAFLEVGSPCVTESKVADPPPIPRTSELPPNPHDPKDPMADGPWGLPYLDSPFWSAES